MNPNSLKSRMTRDEHSLIFTDLYELTMCQAYLTEGMEGIATFELFFRRMPEHRNYIVAAGLEDVVVALENLHITSDEIEYLKSRELFTHAFLEQLSDFRFTGDVHAIPEGTPVFANEPLIQITAPIFQAQLIETMVLNQVHFQSLIASKAARIMTAAEGKAVVDFGSRRAHGSDAALKAARVSYLCGAKGTSNVLSGFRYGIPLFGTMAHSYIQAHDDEFEAFQAFARVYPETTLLVDTYDTRAGIQKVIELHRKWGKQFRIQSVRLDSGDLLELSRMARHMLDDAGLHGLKIFASGGLDEYKIEKLVRAGAPIDAFGVGTSLAVGEQAASVDMAYKLVEYDGFPRMKRSPKKAIYPGRKQVYRFTERGAISHDLLTLHDESCDAEPLLREVMKSGKRVSPGLHSLENARKRSVALLTQLPNSLRNLQPAGTAYPVVISEPLRQKSDMLSKQITSDA